MSSWPETSAVLTRIAALRGVGAPCALATVIRVRGSAYRRPGARLLVEVDGRTTGNVSGGCLEADVREVALRVIRTGIAERRSYCSAGDEISAWDLGVGCEGEVEVLVEPVRDDWSDVRAALALGRSFVVESSLHGDAPRARRVRAAGDDEPTSGLRHASGGDCFVDLLVAPPHLLIVGAGDDALPLARLARDTGFRVTVLDRRPGLLTRDRYPQPTALVDASPSDIEVIQRLVDDSTFVVLMTHNYADDRDYLEAILPTPVRYIGLLGPRQRGERILSQLGATGDARVFGPVGLDIGGEGTEQVAVAILAELLAVRAGRAAGSLRERLTAVHADG